MKNQIANDDVIMNKLNAMYKKKNKKVIDDEISSEYTSGETLVSEEWSSEEEDTDLSGFIVDDNQEIEEIEESEESEEYIPVKKRKKMYRKCKNMIYDLIDEEEDKNNIDITKFTKKAKKRGNELILDVLNEDEDDDEEDDAYVEKGELIMYDADMKIIEKEIYKNVMSEIENEKVKKVLQTAIEKTMKKVGKKYKDVFMTINKPILNKENWKIGQEEECIKQYENELNEIYDEIEKDRQRVSEIGILTSKLSRMEKKKAFLLLERLANMEEFSTEYFELEQQIITLIKSADHKTVEKSIDKIEEELENHHLKNGNLHARVLESYKYIPIDTLKIIYEKYKEYINMPLDSETKVITYTWIEHALNLPHEKTKEAIITKENYGIKLKEIRDALNKEIYGMHNVKDQILCTLNNRFKNPKTSGNVIALYGSPGTGKTVIAKTLAKCMGLPFEQISLGGMQDVSLLTGQHMGWVGSSPGRIVKALENMKYKNGIIFLDEVDKLGETLHGKEVQYSLLHIIDSSQNNEFVDNYMGKDIKIDLSNIFFVVAMNDPTLLDNALLSRMPLIHVENYTVKEKIRIMQDYLIPKIIENIGIQNERHNIFTINDDACRYIIQKMENYHGKEGGVRNVRDCLGFIFNKISLLYELNKYDTKDKNTIVSTNSRLEFPVEIDSKVIDEFYTNKQDHNAMVWKTMYM